MHFKEILQKVLETSKTLDVLKPETTNQNQKKKNCIELEDHIWTKISENQKDFRHSVS